MAQLPVLLNVKLQFVVGSTRTGLLRLRLPRVWSKCMFWCRLQSVIPRTIEKFLAYQFRLSVVSLLLRLLLVFALHELQIRNVARF